MIPRLRSLVSLSSVALLLAGCTPAIRPSASPGETPGITWTWPTPTTSKITVESVNGFSGPATLSASCCRDVIRQRWVSFNQISLTFDRVPVYSPTLSIPKNGSDATVLTMSGWHALAPPFGKFVVDVLADAGSGIKGETRVGIKILPSSEYQPSCRPNVTLLRDVATGRGVLQIALDAQIEAKEKSPASTNITIALYMPPSTTPDAWAWTISDNNSLSPGEALIVLENAVPSGWEKEITTVGCTYQGGTSGKTVRVQGGKSGQMTIKKTEDKTLIFRKPTGIFGLGGWVDVAVFSSDTHFWSVFEGKTMTFKWLSD